MAAQVHDSGKKARQFVIYLNSKVKKRGSVKHAIGGSIVLYQLFKELKDERLVYAIVIVAGHHAGLPDLMRVIDQKIPNAEEYLQAIPALAHHELASVKKMLDLFHKLPPTQDDFKTYTTESGYRAMLTRMCFSALVDADYLDTERYFDAEKHKKRRGSKFSIQQLNEMLESHMNQLREKLAKENMADTILNMRRNEVYLFCREAAKQPSPYRALIVPTGYGKTLASIAYALGHARIFNKNRVIVALPLISIIDQTAQVYKQIFGEQAVLEHHSQMSYTDDEEESMKRAKLATENWGAYPIIVTTTVELFESLFSNRPSKTRKLHRIANSVIILDEFHKLPLHVLAPIMKTLHILMEFFNVTVLMCSATPLSFKNSVLVGNMGEPVDIFPNRDQLFAESRRVNYVRISEPLNSSELVLKMNEHQQTLCILNTRQDAFRVWQEAIRHPKNGKKVYHLSNRMCPDHRKKVIGSIKHDLHDKIPILVIATSLVEAGVDLDFEAVFRAMAPLDSIVQAAGRANRENRSDRGWVYIFELEDGGMPEEIYRRGTVQARMLLDQHGVDALYETWIFEEYFRGLYAFGSEHMLDEPGLMKRDPTEFSTISRLFKMIDEDTVSLICRHYKAAEEQLDRLIDIWKQSPYLSREWFREAQMYAVNEYRNSAWLRNNQHLLERVSEGWYIWHGEYDGVAGIRIPHKEGGE